MVELVVFTSAGQFFGSCLADAGVGTCHNDRFARNPLLARIWPP